MCTFNHVNNFQRSTLRCIKFLTEESKCSVYNDTDDGEDDNNDNGDDCNNDK